MHKKNCKIDLNDTIILIDFDGTITTEDTNIKLFNVFSNEKIRQFQNSKEIKDMNYMEISKRIFSYLNLTEKEYLEFILNDIELTPGYKEFYEECNRNNIPIEIISGGYINGIEPFLRKYNIDDSKVYANKLHFKNKIEVSFYHGEENCCEKKNCGNCKIKHYHRNKKNFQNIIFIGDGTTDIPLANVAEIVYAKDSLLNYCKKNTLDCIPWNDFYDIKKDIFERRK